MEEAEEVDFVYDLTDPQHGYRRLISFENPNASVPLIGLDDSEKTDEELRITIDFTPLTFSVPTNPEVSIGENLEMVLNRNTAENTGETQPTGFTAEEFSPDDGDLPEHYAFETDSFPSDELYIALFTLSFGQDISELEFNIYSTPRYLEYIQLPLL